VLSLTAIGAPAALAMPPAADPAPAAESAPPAADSAAASSAVPQPTEPKPGEVIEISGKAPAGPGVVSVEGDVARRTAGALGEPLRALSLLPGVTTSIAASGYPIIRGTLPGESRFEFDGIELPMLYHLLLGNQVMHPAFMGDLELRAGGYGADHGQMLGGLISISPPPETEHTEVHLDVIEAGGFTSRRLSPSTSIAAAARAGTLAGLVKLYRTDAAVDYVDQQTRLVHRIGGSDELALTSLGAFDHVRLPSTTQIQTLDLGFHRLDARWTHRRPGGEFRIGVQTELDMLRSVTIQLPLPGGGFGNPGGGVSPPGMPGVPDAPADTDPPPPEREGGTSYGARAYADARLALATWLAVRGGVEAHHRTMTQQAGTRFSLSSANDPFLGLARAVDTAAVWAALDLRIGPLAFAPGVRADGYRADMPALTVRHGDVDPRLAITAELPGGARAELAGGRYSAPPQVTVIEGPIAIGPVPLTEGAASTAGLSHGVQAQASLHAPLGAGWQGSLAAYYRDTDYAVDFGMIGQPFTNRAPCMGGNTPSEALVYRHVDIRAMGVEAMVRRQLARSVTGWLSYSLAKIDRDLGFVQLPHDYDQRHAVSASAQWQVGRWLLGGSAQLHTGRPAEYPELATCTVGDFIATDVVEDPTHLRRLPISWRIDLRAEREFRFSSWRMRLYFEMQNASLTREQLGYELTADPIGSQNYRVTTRTLFLPLPMIGVEADL
jgi:hypothetical protein